MKSYRKKSLVILALGLIMILSSCQTIPCDMVPYLKASGIYTLATYAHPTSKISRYAVKTSDDKIYIDILFEAGEKMSFGLKVKSGRFVEMIVLDDTDSVPAFLASGLIKSTIINVLTDSDSDGFIASFERKIGKEINDFSAEEFVLLVLNWDYSNFK